MVELGTEERPEEGNLLFVLYPSSLSNFICCCSADIVDGHGDIAFADRSIYPIVD